MSKQLNLAALQSNPAVLAALMALLGDGKLPRKTRSDKGYTKDLVQEAMTVDQRKAALEQATIVAFTKAGFKDIQPRVNVLTYGKVKDDGTKTGWLAQGRMVRKGEKATKVRAKGMRGSIPLFHVSQTDEIAIEANTTPQS